MFLQLFYNFQQMSTNVLQISTSDLHISHNCRQLRPRLTIFDGLSTSPADALGADKELSTQISGPTLFIMWVTTTFQEMPFRKATWFNPSMKPSNDSVRPPRGLTFVKIKSASVGVQFDAISSESFRNFINVRPSMTKSVFFNRCPLPNAQYISKSLCNL